MRKPIHRQLLSLLAFTFLLTLSLPTQVNAQPFTTPPPTVNIRPYAQGRIFSASTKSPIANTLSQHPQLVQTTDTLINYFNAVQDTVQHSLSVSRRQQPPRNHTVPVCNNRSIPWRSATRNFARHRGWPVDPNATCVTDTYGTLTRSHLTDSQLGDLVVRRDMLVHQYTNDIIKAAGITNWTVSEPYYRFAFNRGSQKCNVESLSAVRVRRKWHNCMGITNRPRREWLPAGEREYLTECLRVEGDKLVAALMTLPINPVVGTEHKVETRSTTILGRWGGAVEPTEYLPAAIEDNLALQDALDKGQHYLQQVDDATTVSNIAILALPLLLSLVPLGLVTEVGTKRMLGYVLISDVVTALPMWIKGVELVGISKQKFTSSATRMGDVGVDEDITVVMEVWISSCGSHENVRAIGIGFIVVATVLMMIGVGLEVLIRIRRRGKRKIGQYEAVLEEFDGIEWVKAMGDDDYDDEEEKVK